MSPLCSETRTTHGQRGAGLVEVLVATAVMTPLILASALGLMTGMRASADAELTQRLGVAMSTATENVKAMAYLPCGTPKEYQSAYERWLEEHPPAIVDDQRAPAPRFVAVTYWDESSASYVPECTEDGGAQRFTLSVTLDRKSAEANIVARAPAPTRTLELRR